MLTRNSNTVNKLNWNLLKTFFVIAQEKSITRAAKRLFLTQPAISSSLKRLEESLEIQLFVRENKKIKLTKAGEKLYRECFHIYGIIANLEDSIHIQDITEISGNIVIHSSENLYFPEMFTLLDAFKEQYPDVDFFFYTGTNDEVAYSVLNQTATLGFLTKEHKSPQFSQKKIKDEPFYLCCGERNALYGKRNITMAMLAEQPFLAYEAEQMSGSFVNLMHYKMDNGLDKTIIAKTVSVRDMLSLIVGGRGIGFLPKTLIDTVTEKIQSIDCGLPAPTIPIYGTINIKGLHNMAEKKFIEFLSENNINLNS